VARPGTLVVILQGSHRHELELVRPAFSVPALDVMREGRNVSTLSGDPAVSPVKMKKAPK
jgi:hypothetical protein